MASILALKRRIKAAQNVSKSTRAMQMIAASKLKKAQNAALSARPYVEKLTQLTQSVASTVDENFKHPYLQQPASQRGEPETLGQSRLARAEADKSLIIVVSPDKGLCGGLVTNLLREFLSVAKEEKEAVYINIGKKLEGRVSHFSKEVIASFVCGTSTPTFDMVYPITKLIDEYYLGKKVDNVKILSTHFGSFFTQTPKITTILPIAVPQDATTTKPFALFEPSTQDILPTLLRHNLEMVIYQQLLESFLSEQAARMLAMQNATNNAKDIISDLQLEYNKTRQAKITSELLDISGGRFNAR